MKIAIIAATLAALIIPTTDANAIPAFARKYGVSCSLCHAPAPRLTEFGETFAGNGFAMTRDEAPRDTIDTGDELLRLLRTLQFALRLDMFGTATFPVRTSEPSVDLQTPWNIKLLTGGELAKRISYYMYFFLGERGEVAGLEDAYIQFTDIAGSGVSLIAGQFQVSDPLFKRELRLQYEDYQPYRIRVGEARADLTYDRGLMALASPWEGGDVALMVVNGQGIAAAQENRLYDTDNLKNVAARVSQQIGPLRVGAFGYLGQERGEFVDDITIWGPDLTLSVASNIELNVQYLRREDTRPLLTLDSPESKVDAAFAELLWSPQGPTGRWHVAGLYNWIDADQPIVSLRAGEEGFLSKYQSVSAGLHYLLQRNVRFSGELGYDLEQERTRTTLGLFLAW